MCERTDMSDRGNENRDSLETGGIRHEKYLNAEKCVCKEKDFKK